MSMENSPSNRPEDFKAAKELVEKNELLKDDEYTKGVLETGIAYNGEPIKDIGEFVVQRLKYLEEEKTKVSAKERDVFVEHSPNPDLEEK